MGLVSISRKNWPRFQAGAAAIEATATYPLGDDFFTIDHGANYFTFFERLGQVQYYVWQEQSRVAAVAAGVLRSVPKGRSTASAWYLCDLKVHPDFRRQRIPLRLLARAFPFNYLRCPRGYAISMDPAQGPNRTAQLLARFRWLRFVNAGQLLLWSLDAPAMRRALPVLEQHRGPVEFLSLGGIKNIVLRSTGQPLRLLHAQFGPLAARGNAEIEDQAVHMFCTVKGDSLSQTMTDMGFTPTASATIISHRMSECDWTWILTSDI